MQKCFPEEGDFPPVGVKNPFSESRASPKSQAAGRQPTSTGLCLQLPGRNGQAELACLWQTNILSLSNAPSLLNLHFSSGKSFYWENS